VLIAQPRVAMRASNVVLIAAVVTFFALMSGLLIGAVIMPRG
jgi:hypothetical protein